MNRCGISHASARDEPRTGGLGWSPSGERNLQVLKSLVSICTAHLQEDPNHLQVKTGSLLAVDTTGTQGYGLVIEQEG